MHRDSGLGKWFSEKWVDISRKDKSGHHPSCGDSADDRADKQRAYPKCRPAAEAASMSSKEKKKAVSQKRRVENKTKRHKGRKPNWVSHNESFVPFYEYAEFKQILESKNTPNNPGLWSKAKSAAKQKFDVYPSAYANAWAAKWYKQHGGSWHKQK